MRSKFTAIRKEIIFLNIIIMLLSFLYCKTVVFADTNNEKPVIISVNTTTDATSEGTNINVVIQAKSNSPVAFINCSLKKPNGGYVYGGGRGTTFKEISPGVWEYKWTDTISKYAPGGVYIYEDISVENKAMLESDKWSNIEININNTILPEKPVIMSVNTTTDVTSEGTNINVVIQAKSNSPVDWLNRSLKNTNGGYVYGGGRGTTFKEISPGVWEYKWTDTISKYAPGGVYTYENISVENKGMLESDKWSNIEININNTILPEKPVIMSVNTTTNVTSEGTNINVVVQAKSNSPVDWINRSLKNPNGESVYGGGRGAVFKEISPGVWEYKWTDTISKYAPSGVYTYENISVENKGMLESDKWSNIEVNVNNRISEDFNKDGVVDIKDIALIAQNYNCKNTDNNWNADYDLNNDLIIDIYDLVKVSKKIN